jgi:hypothetical protein
MPASIVVMELGIFTIQTRVNNVDRWRKRIYNKQNLEKSQILKSKILPLQIFPTLYGKAVLSETERSVTILMNFFRIALERLSMLSKKRAIKAALMNQSDVNSLSPIDDCNLRNNLFCGAFCKMRCCKPSRSEEMPKGRVQKRHRH